MDSTNGQENVETSNQEASPLVNIEEQESSSENCFTKIYKYSEQKAKYILQKALQSLKKIRNSDLHNFAEELIENMECSKKI